jgi:hypothetical protein
MTLSLNLTHLQSQIKLYEPALLIVGTRGRALGGIQGLLPGSISKYCLQNSPIPVIVVRPNNMRARGKRKRQNDPSRQVYRDLLDKADVPDRADVLDRLNVVLEGGQAISQDEAALVAKAIGVDSPPLAALAQKSTAKGSPGARGSPRSSPLVRMQSVDELPPDIVGEPESVLGEEKSSTTNKGKGRATEGTSPDSGEAQT